jgi:hypothetical protein
MYQSLQLAWLFLFYCKRIYIMAKKKVNPGRGPDSEKKNRNAEYEKVEKAHREAEKDIEADPEFSAHSPNDDLDEGETARLGEDVPM